MHVMGRRRGLDALRGAILGAAKGERAPERGMLVVGAGLFHDDAAVAVYVSRALHAAQALEFRIAATYASAFFLPSSQETACVLSERVVLEKEDRLLVLAARDVLDVWAATKDGGRCRRCGQVGGTTQGLDWMPSRISQAEIGGKTP